MKGSGVKSTYTETEIVCTACKRPKSRKPIPSCQQICWLRKSMTPLEIPSRSEKMLRFVVDSKKMDENYIGEYLYI